MRNIQMFVLAIMTTLSAAPAAFAFELKIGTEYEGKCDSCEIKIERPGGAADARLKFDAGGCQFFSDLKKTQATYSGIVVPMGAGTPTPVTVPLTVLVLDESRISLKTDYEDCDPTVGSSEYRAGGIRSVFTRPTAVK